MRTFPIGTDVEVFSFSALNRAWENTQLPSEREHVTPYLRKEENSKIINASGSSKKEAEQKAAKLFLTSIGL